MVTPGGTYRLVKDHRGSVRLVTNASTGAIVQELTYDAWGRVLADTNPGFQPFGFAGGLYDPATGLVRFGVRDYDAEIGRWTAKDPVRFNQPDGPNFYGYLHGDPSTTRIRGDCGATPVGEKAPRRKAGRRPRRARTRTL